MKALSPARIALRRAPRNRRKLHVMQVRVKWPIYVQSLNPPRIPRCKGRAMRLHLRMRREA